MEGLNGFVIWLALPAQLFAAMASVNLEELAQPGFFFSYAIAMFGTSLLYVLLNWKKETNSVDKIVEAMSASYSNAGFMGIPLALMLFGQAGLVPAIFTMLFAVCILFATSILAVELIKVRGQGLWPALCKVTNSLVRNPILIAPILGVAWSQTHWTLPTAVSRYVDLIAAASTPAALISIGLFLAQPQKQKKYSSIKSIVALKLFFQPAVTALLCLWIFDVPTTWAMVAILMSALPVGSGPFMLARMYDREADVGARAILISTVLSIFTVSSLIALIEYKGHCCH